AAKHHRVDESDLGAPLEDRELGGSGEHSHHVPEVHTAVPSLAGGASEEKFAVLYEKLLGDHMVDDRVGLGSVQRSEGREVMVDVPAAQCTSLQGEAEDLLGDHVVRARRWFDRLHIPL